jgi:2-C-methyl-D-erythritol 4-phosphate cytidylyltransferase/2-C-methyl-D-erythritol 2,4-cyclodiphosphate synthase
MAENVAILLAAGNATRMGENKMFMRIGGKSVIERTMSAFNDAACFDKIIVVCRQEDEEQIEISAQRCLTVPYEIVYGGEERQHSVANALKSIAHADVVAVHDAARCFVQPSVVRECVQKTTETSAAAAGIRTTDTIKQTNGDMILSTLDRNSLVNIQTPQAFSFELLMRAHEKAQADGYIGTDECSLVERMGVPIAFVAADAHNIKVTTPQDIAIGRHIVGERIRVGTGYDVHRLVKGRRLVLGGETIPYKKGLKGHSDADVLLHAIMDAILGAAANRDIGHHFPCIDEFVDANSLSLLARTVGIIEKDGFNVTGIDATVILERPRLSPYIDNMRVNIASAVGIDVCFVSVKATTTEGLGFEGKGKGIAASAIVTLIG